MLPRKIVWDLDICQHVGYQTTLDCVKWPGCKQYLFRITEKVLAENVAITYGSSISSAKPTHSSINAMHYFYCKGKQYL